MALARRSSEEEVVKALAAVSIVAVLAVPLAAQNPADQATGAPAPAAPAQTPAAQTPAAPPAEQGGSVFRSGASLVALNVTVSDGKRLVPGLKQDDFAVYEDGVLQHVQFFEAQRSADRSDPPHRHQCQHGRQDGRRPRRRGRVSRHASRSRPWRGRHLRRPRQHRPAADRRSKRPRAGRPRRAGERLDRAEQRACTWR